VLSHKVYLLRKNIKTQRPSNKLDFKKIKPFKIEEQIRKVNYKLRLSENMQIHPVFYVSVETSTNSCNSYYQS